MPDAFRRRPPTHSHPDIHGLSVSHTYEEAVALGFGYGAIKVTVAKLNAIGLSIEHNGNHATIWETPYDTPENSSEVLRYANAIIKCCA